MSKSRTDSLSVPVSAADKTAALFLV